MTSYNPRTDGLRLLNMSDQIQLGDQYFKTSTKLVDVPVFLIGLSIESARAKMYPNSQKTLEVYRQQQPIRICADNATKIFVTK
jgi:hypothetical protein